MQSILRRVNVSEMMAASLPAGVTFPLACHADVESIEEKLQDTQTKNTLVRPTYKQQHLYHFFLGTVKPRLHDTTCCQTGLSTGCIVYTNIQPV